MTTPSTPPTPPTDPSELNDPGDAAALDDQAADRERRDKRLRRIVLFGALALVVVLAVRGNLIGGEDQVPWQSDYQAAAATAHEAGRPMLLYFGADWCTGCRALERRSFSQERVAQSIERHYVPVKVDMTDPGVNEHQLGERYGITHLPTLVITDADGQPLTHPVGPLSTDGLLEWLGDHRTAAARPTPTSDPTPDL